MPVLVSHVHATCGERTLRSLLAVKVHHIVHVRHLANKAIREPLRVLALELTSLWRRVLDLEPDERQRPVFQRLLVRLDGLPLLIRLRDHLLDDLHELGRDLVPVLLLLVQALEALILREDELSCDERPDCLERDLVHLEVLPRDAENRDVFLDCFSRDE